MYPYIMGEILRMIHRFSQQNHKLILLDAPTLFESRADDFCDLIISVVAKPELRMQRIMERDHISMAAAKQRMEMQLTEEFFRLHSDTVLENNASFSELRDAAQELSAKLICYYETEYGAIVIIMVSYYVIRNMFKNWRLFKWNRKKHRQNRKKNSFS